MSIGVKIKTTLKGKQSAIEANKKHQAFYERMKRIGIAKKMEYNIARPSEMAIALFKTEQK